MKFDTVFSHCLIYMVSRRVQPRAKRAFFLNGHSVETPDLAQGDFRNLTISGQLEVIERTLGGEAALLIGSSMGGYLAALYAARHPEIPATVLLAPAFDFHSLWTQRLGPRELARWRDSGDIMVFHYGLGRELPLSYRFLEEAQRYAPFPPMHQPGLIFHGTNDDVTPLEGSVEFAASHTAVTLVRVTSGHELTDVLEDMWPQTLEFSKRWLGQRSASDTPLR